MIITRKILDDHCRQCAADMQPKEAFAACRALGPYARWWLHPDVLTKARMWNDTFPQYTTIPDCANPNDFPTTPGVCYPLFVRGEEFSALAPAYVVPVRWRRGSHSGVPNSLTREADRVSAQFGASGWGLAPALGWELADGLELPSGSAWASLAGALALARDGLHSQPGVFASACWDSEYGAGPVDKLAEKQGTAVRHGGRMFAVAPGNINQARASAPKGVSLNSGTNPRTVLQPYLAELGAPSQVDAAALDADDQFRRGVAYYQLLPFRSQAHRNYYFDQLLPTVRNRLRGHLAANPAHQPATALAAIVSDGWELIPVLATAFGVERVLLLHTSRYARYLPDVCRRLAERGISGGAVVPCEFHIPTMRQEVTERLTQFAGTGSDALVIDVTLGTALMTLTLEQLARAKFQRSRLVYVAHRTPDGRLEPGTEYPLIWQAGCEMPDLPFEDSVP